MKYLFVLAVSALLLTSCGNERTRTMNDYEAYIVLQEDLTEKVLKEGISETDYDKELDKDANFKIVRAGEDAKHNLLEVKDLLTEKEKSCLVELILRDKRNQQELIDAFLEKKKAEKAAKAEKKK